jgi:hypothetical protein
MGVDMGNIAGLDINSAMGNNSGDNGEYKEKEKCKT